MRGINLKQCLVCRVAIAQRGLFCAQHDNAVAEGMAKAAPPTNKARLKAEAEARMAARKR